jgi:DNA-binding MarR family transcriptional regulator
MGNDFFNFAKGKQGMPGEKTMNTYVLTNEGKARLKAMAGTESEFAVLAAINQYSPAPVTMDEIVENSNLGYAKTKHIVQQLRAYGWVTKGGARAEG